MNSSLKHYEKDFLNYLDGTLSDDRKEQFEKALQENEELQTSLHNYRRIVLMEQKISREDFVLDERFVSKVMARVSRPSFFRRLFMELKHPSRTFIAGLGSLAVVTLCVALVYGPEYRNFQAGADKPLLGTDMAVEPAVREEAVLSGNASGPELLKTEVAGGRDPAVAAVGQVVKNKSSKAQDMSVRTEMKAPTRMVDTLEAKSLSAPSAVSNLLQLRKRSTSRVGIDGIVASPASGFIPYDSWGQDTNREQYLGVTENTPVLTSQEPMSTFSIDVDTGSYTNARRFLQQGQLPPPESVRIEEFVNYFHYNYPTQSAEPFAANFEVAPSLDGSGKYLLKIGIKAKESGFDGKEKPWNLVFLVDVSGSMNAQNKLPLVQRSLELLTKNMRSQDKVSIVTYAGSTGVLLPPTGIQERAKIISAIENLRSGGGTYGSAGIVQAYNTAKSAFIRDGVNRVILATDGDFNVGITNRDELIKLIEQKRKSGITLTTLGFGTGNYNEAMMEQLANKGNGNYFYIDGYREARKVFEEDLFGTIEVVAKDVKLQIEFNPEHVTQYRLVGYENRKLKNEDFANDRIDAGEIGAGHTVTALYELVLSGTDAANTLSPQYRYKKKSTVEKTSKPLFAGELAFLKIRFKAPTGKSSKLLTFPLKRSSVKESLKNASTDFRFAASVAAFAAKLRQSQYAPDMSFDEIAILASKNDGKDSHGYRREFVELVKNAASIAHEE